MAYEKEMHDFALFLNMTKEDKIQHFGYHTQGEFAKAYGLPHQKILSEWKSKPKFQKLQKNMFVDTVKDILPDVKKTLARRGIEDGDVNALKELLKLGGHHDKLEVVSDSEIEDVIINIVSILENHLKEQPKILKAILDEIGELDG